MSKHAVIILFLEIGLFLLSSDGRKIPKITRKNLFHKENFVEGGSGDDDSSAAFSDWSEWTRCNRNCKQVRTRSCKKPEVCQNKVEKMQKVCPSVICKVRITVPLPKYENSSYRPSKGEVLQHMEPFLYTEWSKWSPCSESCITKRTRKCRYKLICGGVQEQSEKCYSEEGDCEEIEHPREPVDLEEKDESHPLDNIVCGVTKVAPDSRIMGGKRAKKGSWPWQ
ncbi:uncharacterized protein LOC118203313, partial [Stegodyphus dumicola]|uniref:uncharacterized protein LOC118203313 n=1 Tax=Stegodyphus dumicola TaxID=202533 RepID=UPI0015A8EFD7